MKQNASASLKPKSVVLKYGELLGLNRGKKPYSLIYLAMFSGFGLTSNVFVFNPHEMQKNKIAYQ